MKVLLYIILKDLIKKFKLRIKLNNNTKVVLLGGEK